MLGSRSNTQSVYPFITLDFASFFGAYVPLEYKCNHISRSSFGACRALRMVGDCKSVDYRKWMNPLIPTTGLTSVKPVFGFRGFEGLGLGSLNPKSTHPRLVSIGSVLRSMLYHSSHHVTRQSFSARHSQDALQCSKYELKGLPELAQ